MTNITKVILKPRSGQSVLEVIIAMAFFALISTSLVSLILGGLALLSTSGRIVQADFLAQEELEAARAIKSKAWNEMIYSTSSVIVSGGMWEFAGEGTTEQAGIFSRTLIFSPVYRLADGSLSVEGDAGAAYDPQSRMARALVVWDGGIQGPARLERDMLLTNWDRKEWIQSDWIEGDGQEIWLSPGKFDSSDGNIGYESAGSVSLKEIATSTYAASGYIVSSAFSIGPEGSYVSIGWDADIPPDCPVCAVKFQIMTASDSAGVPGEWNSEWIGPEGVDSGEDDYFTEPSFGMIDRSTNGRQWIRYKAVLSGEPTRTPVLNEVRIGYQK